MRRELTASERLLIAEWYLDRIGVREYDGKNVDTETRNRVVIHLLASGVSKEEVARSFHLTTAGLSRIVNRIKREHGVAAEKSASKSGS